MWKGFWLVSFVLLLLAANTSDTLAEPLLQLYLEGATYDTVTDTWVLSPPGSSNGQPFRLWAIGNVDSTPGHFIEGVKLSVAYDKSWRANGNDLVIALTPSTTGGLGNFDDPSTPSNPTFLQYGAAGTRPLLGDLSPLPWHGIFGPDTVWQEFALGDPWPISEDPDRRGFGLMDSPIGDFINTFPTQDVNAPLRGQINVYEVIVTWTGGASASGAEIHFDLYNHYTAGNHVKTTFAPFSHDADGDVNIVPAPSTSVGLITMGLMGAIAYGRRRLKRAAAA